MEEVVIFISAVRADNAVTTLTRIRTIHTRFMIEIKDVIKDFILEFKDERKWVGGYFEQIKIYSKLEKRNNAVVIKIEEQDRLMKEFNELLK